MRQPPHYQDCTVLFTILGVTFLEDPVEGDETSMWAEYKGVVYGTDWWDRPSEDEVKEWIKEITGAYETDPEDIYDTPSMRQSVEEDRN